MELELEQLLEKRKLDGGGIIRAFGRSVSASHELSETEYEEVCKEFKRAKDGEGKGGSTEFKKERFLTFVASDETKDSYGDILRVDGVDLSRFKSGAGAFITSHDMKDVSGAAGLIVKAWRANDSEGSPNNKAVMVRVYFPTFEEDPDADRVYKKFMAGTLRSVSVGFTPLEAYYPKDEAERKQLGLGKFGIEFRKWQPYELSAVTVPANPNANIRKSAGEASAFAELLLLVKELKQDIEDLKRMLPEKETVNEESTVDKVKKYLEQHPISF